MSQELALTTERDTRGISEAQWNTLTQSLFPGARPESVLMVWDYCRARGLDPLKKPCHIVPMEVKDAKIGKYVWRDVVMPGIYEYRTTAHRTGQYFGHSDPTYGPTVKAFGVDAPEWCAMTIYRGAAVSHPSCRPFPIRVYFREVCTLTKEGQANKRWKRAPVQMLTKVAEAAGLREAFPEELGGEPTIDEMEGQHASDLDQERPQPAEPRRIGEGQTPAVAASSDNRAPAGEAAAAQTPASASPPSQASASPSANGAHIESGAMVTDTTYVPAQQGNAEHWEISTTRGLFVTKDQQLLRVAEELEGTGQRCTIAWVNGQTAKGKKVRILKDLVEDVDEPGAAADAEGEQGELREEGVKS